MAKKDIAIFSNEMDNKKSLNMTSIPDASNHRNYATGGGRKSKKRRVQAKNLRNNIGIKRSSGNSESNTKVMYLPNFVAICRGNFSQGDEQFVGIQRGAQCTPNCIISICHSTEKLPSQWDAADMDFILIRGDQLYRESKETGYRYKSVDEIKKEFILTKDILYKFEIDDDFTTNMVELFDATIFNEHGLFILNLKNLVKVINECLVNHNKLIITVVDYTYAIMSEPKEDTRTVIYHLFDSHGRGPSGDFECSESDVRTSCLTTFASIEQLAGLIIRNHQSDAMNGRPFQVSCIFTWRNGQAQHSGPRPETKRVREPMLQTPNTSTAALEGTKKSGHFRGTLGGEEKAIFDKKEREQKRKSYQKDITKKTKYDILGNLKKENYDDMSSTKRKLQNDQKKNKYAEISDETKRILNYNNKKRFAKMPEDAIRKLNDQKRAKYAKMSEDEKKKLSIRNKKKYVDMSDYKKKNLSDKNKIKYADMPNTQKETLSDKNKEKYADMPIIDKKILSDNNKQKYEDMPITDKKILSDKNKEKYADMPITDKKSLSDKNKEKYSDMPITEKETLSYKNKEKYADMPITKKETLNYKKKEKYAGMPNIEKENLKNINKTKYANMSDIEKQEVLERSSQRQHDMYHRQTESERNKYIKKQSDRFYQKLYQNYNDIVRQGPTDICVCCGGLWFPTQIKIMPDDKIESMNVNLRNEVFAVTIKIADRTNSFCQTCYGSIIRGNVPTLCLNNGLHFSEIPECLKNLSLVEEILLAGRIPFMRIFHLGYERQCAIRGQVVNVPISVDTTVKSLPRAFNETHVIQVHLKRQLKMKHDYMCEFIRPGYVLNALNYLIKRPAYLQAGIAISDNWLEANNWTTDHDVPFVVSDEDMDIVATWKKDQAQPTLTYQNDQANPLEKEEAHLDEYEKGDEILNPGGQETLLDNENVENIALAPGEGQQPLSLLNDPLSEALGFPKIYCGEIRKVKRKLTYKNIARSEIRRYDRRCARTDKLFYMYKRCELECISRAISLCLRKKSGTTAKETVRQMLDDEFVSKLIQHDDGFRMFETIPSSPSYWQREKKRVVAMVRQFGTPTFFITLSAAETRWPELLVILSKVVDNVQISEEDAINLEFKEKARLIRTDPITCARYFDHRIRTLLKLFKSSTGIFGENYVTHHYFRIEVQQRGSLHLHGMFWLAGAPQIDIERNPLAAVEFIDRFSTTDSNSNGVEEYIGLQRHSHTKSCLRKKGNETFCRFHVPRPPMRQTLILTPFKIKKKADETGVGYINEEPVQENCDAIQISEVEFKRHKRNFKKIKAFLETKINITNKSFDEFLHQIGMTDKEYEGAIRSSIRRLSVFLKRRLIDVYINAFNIHILKLHRANMDIQYITDPYACINYIVNYISKSDKGISKLMANALAEVESNNLTVRKKLQVLGNKFVNGVEISAQEAAYCLLGLHMSDSSHASLFINTFPPEKRVRLVKSRKELVGLEEESTDIFIPNLLDHYANRPKDLDGDTLAWFAAYYQFARSANPKKVVNNTEEEMYGDSNIESQNVQPHNRGLKQKFSVYRLADGSGYIRRRSKPKVLQYAHFSEAKDPQNFYREQVMLFLPWRDEEDDILKKNAEEIYRENERAIKHNASLLCKLADDVDLDEALRKIVQDDANDDDDEEAMDENVPGTDEEYRIYGMQEPEFDLFKQLDIPENNKKDVAIVIKLPSEMPDEVFRKLVQTLNQKQRSYLTHMLHKMRMGETIFEFVSGGAGVGKSRLITALYHSISKFFDQQRGSDPNKMKVVLCAPTGKAAFNIGGATLHSIFHLPLTHSNFTRLSHDLANTLFCEYMHLKFVIIDEISMVGSRMFSQVNHRLQQIFKSNKDFAGVSIIVFGDLNQLRPVGDQRIFQHPKKDVYGKLCGDQNYLWQNFGYFELTEIMRQRDDKNFALALNRLAKGKMTVDDVKLISGRERYMHEIPLEAIHLFTSNDEVDKFNQLRLGMLDTESAISTATDFVKGTKIERHRQEIIRNVQEFSAKDTCGLPTRLQLKVSGKYMVTSNIDTKDGLVNGATGILRQIDIKEIAGERKPHLIWMEFDGDSVGRDARSKRYCPNPLWTPVAMCIKSFQYRKNMSITIDRLQFPIVPAEGLTIHKSQGATYKSVAVHLRSRMDRALLYVALSRATAASGLYIVGKFQDPGTVHPKNVVLAEIERLKTERQIALEFHRLLSPKEDEGSIRLMYHNVQSIHKHFQDVISDEAFLHSDLILLVETWTLPEENYDIPEFTQFARIDNSENKTRSPKGILCYVKSRAAGEIDNIISINLHDRKDYAHLISFKFKNIFFAVLYRSKNFKIARLNSEIRNFITSNQDSQVIVVGDFNIDLLKNPRNETSKMFIQHHLESCLMPNLTTTNEFTQIDWAYANIIRPLVITASVYETVFSYHNPISLEVKEILSDKSFANIQPADQSEASDLHSQRIA